MRLIILKLFVLFSVVNAFGNERVTITTDKAVYKPGEVVRFTINHSLHVTTKICYKFCGKTIKTDALKGTKWDWKPPVTDFKGYMVELRNEQTGVIYGTIAVDVSSNRAKFPRNGFLSAYGKLSNAYMDSVMKNLNRYHMNYVQFQDWEYEHHKPLAGTVIYPDEQWKDIGSRDNDKTTVQTYISLAHSYHMLTLHYNLIYGALDNAGREGVADEWRLFTDNEHKNPERIPLPMPPFKSGLNIINPANKSWQKYIANRTMDALKVYDFDGYQIDQMGDLNKPLYDYGGKKVEMDETFEPFIKAMHQYMPGKRLVMNAVANYGQTGIAKSPVDFLYTEVWPPEDGFKELAGTITHNDSLTGGQKRTVMPAYMDYGIADKPGYFNTPGIILTDAVIFAFGGAHLELGDHMLGKEYFPNDHLKMHDDLQATMVSYYDFMTAYENLLRDGGKYNAPNILAGDKKTKVNSWPPKLGEVSVIGKVIGNRQVLHFINFTNANSLHWRDNKGTQAKPTIIPKPAFIFKSPKAIRRIWLASPDLDGGASSVIPFKQSGNNVSFTLSSLYYWDMVVVEYK